MIIDLRPGFCQIRSQGDLGSCTAFAATAILEYIRNCTEGWFSSADKQGRHFSPRFVWYNGRPFCEYQPHVLYPECPLHRNNHRRDVSTGSSSWTLDGIKKFGFCEENDWEYDGCCGKPLFRDSPQNIDHIDNKFAFEPPAKCFADARNLHSKYLKKIEEIDRNPETWIRELKQRNPLYFSMHVNSAFMNAKGKTFFDNYSDLPDLSAGHAVVLLGYNDRYPDPKNPGKTTEAFLLRNSWGHQWGDQGYLWVSREFITHSNILQGHQYVFIPKDTLKELPRFNGPKQVPSVPTPIPPVSVIRVDSVNPDSAFQDAGKMTITVTGNNFVFNGNGFRSIDFPYHGDPSKPGLNVLSIKKIKKITPTHFQLKVNVSEDIKGYPSLIGMYDIHMIDHLGAHYEKENVFEIKDPNAPQPQPPAPAAPPPTPGPAPAPVAPPQPQPPTQPVHPTHPSGHGDFIYQWWLFDNTNDYNKARYNLLSPYTLANNNKGRKIDGPPGDNSFGKLAQGKDLRAPAAGHAPPPNFVDTDEAIRSNTPGKILALGACRLAEIPSGTSPVTADGFWKWDLKPLV